MTSPKEVKVQFHLNPDEGHGMRTENLWAEQLAPGKFRILNSPFFIFGVSIGDIVSAEEKDRVLQFKNVISRGGHSTYRIFLQRGRTINSSDFQSYWKPISQQGATFENANSHFVAVDVPSAKNVAEIYKFLEKGEEDGVWIFEEAHYVGAPL